MTCPECGSDSIEVDHDNSTDDVTAYECQNCGEQFDEDEAGE